MRKIFVALFALALSSGCVTYLPTASGGITGVRPVGGAFVRVQNQCAPVLWILPPVVSSDPVVFKIAHGQSELVLFPSLIGQNNDQMTFMVEARDERGRVLAAVTGMVRPDPQHVVTNTQVVIGAQGGYSPDGRIQVPAIYDNRGRNICAQY